MLGKTQLISEVAAGALRFLSKSQQKPEDETQVRPLAGLSAHHSSNHLLRWLGYIRPGGASLQRGGFPNRQRLGGCGPLNALPRDDSLFPCIFRANR